MGRFIISGGNGGQIRSFAEARLGIAVEEVSEAAEDGAFAFTRGSAGGEDTVGHAGEGKGLQVDGAMAAKGGEEKSFAAEEHAFETTGALDVVLDAR